MTFTYKFYDKAEATSPIDIMSFEGESEKDIKDQVIDYCDTYGYEAFTLISQKPKKRVWTEDEIRTLIQTNDEVLYNGLKKLYACQTADEQEAGATKIHNGKGFNSVDAKFLTSVSQFLIRTGFLTSKQKAAVRKKLVKYNKQLTAIANA